MVLRGLILQHVFRIFLYFYKSRDLWFLFYSCPFVAKNKIFCGEFVLAYDVSLYVFYCKKRKAHLLLKKCATCLFIHKKNKKRQKYCFARRKRVNLHVINLFLS